MRGLHIPSVALDVNSFEFSPFFKKKNASASRGKDCPISISRCHEYSFVEECSASSPMCICIYICITSSSRICIHISHRLVSTFMHIHVFSPHLHLYTYICCIPSSSPICIYIYMYMYYLVFTYMHTYIPSPHLHLYAYTHCTTSSSPVCICMLYRHISTAMHIYIYVSPHVHLYAYIYIASPHLHVYAYIYVLPPYLLVFTFVTSSCWLAFLAP